MAVVLSGVPVRQLRVCISRVRYDDQLSCGVDWQLIVGGWRSTPSIQSKADRTGRFHAAVVSISTDLNEKL